MYTFAPGVRFRIQYPAPLQLLVAVFWLTVESFINLGKLAFICKVLISGVKITLFV